MHAEAFHYTRQTLAIRRRSSAPGDFRQRVSGDGEAPRRRFELAAPAQFAFDNENGAPGHPGAISHVAHRVTNAESLASSRRRLPQARVLVRRGLGAENRTEPLYWRGSTLRRSMLGSDPARRSIMHVSW